MIGVPFLGENQKLKTRRIYDAEMGGCVQSLDIQIVAVSNLTSRNEFAEPWKDTECWKFTAEF